MPQWSGMFDGQQGTNYSLLVNKAPLRKRVSRTFREVGSFSFRQLMLTLNGVVAGSTATKSMSRAKEEAVAGLAASNGGKRTIESRSLINRATTAADVTAISNMLQDQTDPSSYPTDKSGNGGGGQLGKI